jgi:hypothetical protein
MKKLVLIAGFFSVSAWAMDTMQVKSITGQEFEANRKARVAAIQQRPLFRKTPQDFEKEQLILGYESFGKFDKLENFCRPDWLRYCSEKKCAVSGIVNIQKELRQFEKLELGITNS